jgi:hypothetical protein
MELVSLTKFSAWSQVQCVVRSKGKEIFGGIRVGSSKENYTGGMLAVVVTVFVWEAPSRQTKSALDDV